MKIVFNLSPASIKAAKEQTKAAYDQWIRGKWDVFLSKLAQEAVRVARENVTEDTGDLLSGIGYDCIRPGLWRIYAYAPNSNGENYTWYVEYGTGVVGAASPHPEAGEIGWNYDVNGHGEDGWVYPVEKGSHHHYIRGSDSLAWTKGQEGKQFMYKSRQHILTPEVYERIAKEVFG